MNVTSVEGSVGWPYSLRSTSMSHSGQHSDPPRLPSSHVYEVQVLGVRILERILHITPAGEAPGLAPNATHAMIRHVGPGGRLRRAPHDGRLHLERVWNEDDDRSIRRASEPGMMGMLGMAAACHRTRVSATSEHLEIEWPATITIQSGSRDLAIDVVLKNRIITTDGLETFDVHVWHERDQQLMQSLTSW